MPMSAKRPISLATVGYLNVLPNAVNIVPAKVELKIDLRDLSQEHLDNILSELKQQLNLIAEATKTEIVITQALHVLPNFSSSKNSRCDRPSLPTPKLKSHLFT